MRSPTHILVTLLLTGLSLAACSKSADQKLLDARTLVAGGKHPERAEQLLTSVLEQRPDSVDAGLLLADAHRQQGDYQKAESQLDAVANQLSIQPNQQSGLSQNQRAHKHLLKEHFTKLFVDWSDALDPADTPDSYVDILQRGLQWAPSHIGLNQRLVDFYWAKGQRLEQRGDKSAAARAYSRILSLQVPSDSNRPRKARARAERLRLEAFKQQARQAWNDGANAKLAEHDGISTADDHVTLEVEQAFGSRIQTDDPKEVERARAAVQAKLTVLLRKLVLAVSQLPDDADLTVIGDNRAADIMLAAAMPDDPSNKTPDSDDGSASSDDTDTSAEGIEISYRTITLRTRMPLDDIFEMAYDIQAAYRQATDSGDAQPSTSNGQGGRDDRPSPGPDASP